MILSMMLLILGCRALSVALDPDKNTPKKQLKVVKRDKPNLADETEEREVDPDSDELVEATDEEAANEKAIAEMPANTAGSDANSSPDDANVSQGKPVTVEIFAKSLIGTWVNEREKVIVDQNRMIFYQDGKLVTDTQYRIVDDKTVEFTDGSGKKNSAIMHIEDNNTTLVWQRPDLNEVFRYKRAEPDAHPQQQPKKPVKRPEKLD